MGKRGPQPGTVSRRNISQDWTPELAYAIGLLATDGCLSPAGHLVDLTSKDKEQLENFSKCLRADFTIGTKAAKIEKRISFRVQFKNVMFYQFLETIGLTPRKSKTIGRLNIPPMFLWDFLRGVYDGDGCSYSYWDTRWRSSFMFYTSFVSASHDFVKWLQDEIQAQAGVLGRIEAPKSARAVFQLRYAKKGSLVVLRRMYHRKEVVCLSRKRLKVEKFLATVGEQL